MCGVIGTLAFGGFEDKKMERIRQEAMIFFGSELLQLTVARGKDATGVSVLFDDCNYMGLKMGVSATEFVGRFGGKETDFEGFLKIWRSKRALGRFLMGHCRKPSTSVGAGAEDNVNNHPIKVQDTVIVHNGTLTNHEIILTKLGGARDGKVDSEAIPRLLNHIIKNGAEPFSTPALVELCKRLNGTFACLGFNGNNPFQVVGFTDGKPLVFALVKPLKLLLVASEREYLQKVIFSYNMLARLYSSPNSVPLRKGDIEIAAAADLSTFLFDLRDDVTAETKIEDLYETAKVPLLDKIWKPVAKAVNTPASQQNYSRHQTPNVTAPAGKPTDPAKKTPVAQVTVNPAPAQQGAGGAQGHASSMMGMAFNRQTGAFANVGEKKSDDMKHVILNIEEETAEDAFTGAVIAAGKKKQTTGGEASCSSTKGLSLTPSNQRADNLMADTAKVVNIHVADPPRKANASSNGGDGIIAVHKNGRTTSGNSGKAEVIEVDFEAHPDAVAAANEAAKSLVPMKDENDVALFLEIEPKHLNHLAPERVCSRLRKIAFRSGFIAGWAACLKDAAAPTPALRVIANRQKRKIERAEKVIRASKQVVGLFTKLIPTDKLQERMDGVVKEVMEKGGIDAEGLRGVLKPGDVRENKVLGCFVDVFNGKQGR
jgi:hypothetical protein